MLILIIKKIGPKHCNIFTKAEKYASNFSVELKKNGERIQNEIKRILAQPVPLPPVNKKLLLSKQCLELTKYMEKFRNEVKKKELYFVVDRDPSHSERPIMGASSPRHNSRYDDSENSSETPPTYQMLNYQENLNRYFNSNPVETMPPDFDLTDTFNEPVFKLSPVQKGSDESGGSGKLSVSSSNQMASVTNTSGNSNENLTKELEQLNEVLTSDLINQHIKEMETMLIKSHKKRRIAKNDKVSKMETDEIIDLDARNPAMKRSHPVTSSENELNPKHHLNELQYRMNVDENESPSVNATQQIVGPINQIALMNNFNFVPVIQYVSASSYYAKDADGIRLEEVRV